MFYPQPANVEVSGAQRRNMANRVEGHNFKTHRKKCSSHRNVRRGAQDKSLLAPLLPHKCGLPPGYGTPHLCGSEELCRAPFEEIQTLLVLKQRYIRPKA